MFKKILTSSLIAMTAMVGFFSEVQLSEKGILVTTNTTSYAADPAGSSTVPAASGNKDTKSGTQNQNEETKKMLNNLVSGVNIILDFITIIVSPAIMLASWLMSPDWTSGDLFGIRPVLHNMWIVISNITYLIYAILLIVIAIATIFNSEHYGYKRMLPKLALGIILVPLTWWGVQFTVSVATYVTAAAISVPYESVNKINPTDGFWTEPTIPKSMTYENDKTYLDGKTAIGKDQSVSDFCKTNPGSCIPIRDFVKKSGGMFSPLIVYSFGVFKIQDIKKIDNNADAVTSIFSIIHQGLVGALMFIVYGLLVLALIFMLLMRAMKLWFYAIFSPLFTIKYVLGDKGFGDADKDGSFKITEFVGLAFVPAVVSLALGFGLVIVSSLMSPLNSTNNKDNKCVGDVCTIVIMGNPENTIVSKKEKTSKGEVTNTTITIGGVSYTWKGSVSPGGGMTGTTKSALSATGNIFGTIIIDIIALVFVWIAFMAGKGVSKAASKAIEPFEAMGKKIGDLGMSLPKYTPIPGMGGMSMKSMEKVASMPEQFLSQKASESTKGIEQEMGKMFGVNLPYGVTEEARAKEVLKQSKIDSTDLEKLKQVASSVKDKGLDPTTENGKKFIDDMSNGLKRAVEGGVKTNIPGLDEKIKKATTPEEKNAIIASWIAGKQLEGTDAVNFLKKTGGAVATNGSTTPLASATRNGNNVTLNIGSTPIQIENKEKTGDIIKITGLDALKDKKGVMTKSELMAELEKQMSSDAAKKVVEEIASKYSGFFK